MLLHAAARLQKPLYKNCVILCVITNTKQLFLEVIKTQNSTTYFISIIKRGFKASGSHNKVYERTILRPAKQYQNVCENFLKTTQSA